MKPAKAALATLCFLLSLALCPTCALAGDFNETQRLAEQGNAEAQFKLGLMYEIGGGVLQDKKKAVEWYQKAADQNHADAQFSLGLMYYDGKGVRQDKQMATEWFQKATIRGNVKAQFNLGVMYDNGEGMRQNKVAAKEWFGKACDNGHEDGCKAYKVLNEAGY